MTPWSYKAAMLFAALVLLHGCGGGGSSTAPPVAPADTLAPVIVVDTPLDGSLTSQPGQTLLGHLSEPATLTVNGRPAQVDAANQFSFGPVTLTEGSNTFVLMAADLASNTAEVELSDHAGQHRPGAGRSGRHYPQQRDRRQYRHRRPGRQRGGRSDGLHYQPGDVAAGRHPGRQRRSLRRALLPATTATC